MKPHAIMIPYPAQGHIDPLLKLAKYLHLRGFYITFVHTEFIYQRLVRSQGSDSVKGLDDFQYKTIPDGLPPSDLDTTQDIPALSQSIHETCAVPFINLVKNLNESADSPRVSCIIADGVMSSITLDAAEELDIPEFLFFTMSACGFMGYVHFAQLVAKGYVPLQDETWLTNGYLDTRIDWIPGMKDIRLKDLPSFIRTTNPDDILLNYIITQYKNAIRAKGLILNTFDELEKEVIEAISEKFGHVYTIGPLCLLEKNAISGQLNSTVSLWKQDEECLEWLEQQEADSVIYVNYGSTTMMSAEQLSEFAWGLADSKRHFLWIVRPDLVQANGSSSGMLPKEFYDEIKDRGRLAEWCSQEQVLAHPSIGVFLTHCGWNSTIESITSGVPMICWPFFSEQPTNCKYACLDWSIGVELESNATRENVADSVKEMMEGGKGRDLKNKALEWKEKARLAKEPGGSSYENMEELIGCLSNSCTSLC